MESRVTIRGFVDPDRAERRIKTKTTTFFQHFERTSEFAIFEIDGKEVVEETRKSNGGGCGALTGVLKEESVDVLIRKGVGSGTINVVCSVGIQVGGEISENVRQVAEASSPKRWKKKTIISVTVATKATVAAPLVDDAAQPR